jgi:hypothetical protein
MAQQAVEIANKKQQTKQQASSTPQNAQAAIAQLGQALSNQGITNTQLGSIASVIRNINQQGNIVSSTKNPVTDAVLRILGFTIQ